MNYKKKSPKTFSSFRKFVLYSRKLDLVFFYKTFLANLLLKSIELLKKPTGCLCVSKNEKHSFFICNGASQLCIELILGIPVLKTYFKNICCTVLLYALSAEPKSKQAADPQI